MTTVCEIFEHLITRPPRQAWERWAREGFKALGILENGAIAYPECQLSKYRQLQEVAGEERMSNGSAFLALENLRTERSEKRFALKNMEDGS